MQPPPNMKTAAPRAAPLQPAGGRTFYKDIIIERIFPFVQMKIYQNGKTGNERKKGREMAEGVGKFTELIPVLLQEEVSDIEVTLMGYGIFRGQQICHLDMLDVQ